MSLTPGDVESVVFKRERRGYAEREVDAFLDRVQARLRELETENAHLHERVGAADADPPARADVDALLSRTLVLAQRTADEAVAEARSSAERALQEATAHADELVAAARAEAAAITSEARSRVAAEVDAARVGARRTEQAIDELRRFRAGYRDRVHAVIAEQLALLEGAADIPVVGDDVAERARAVTAEATAAAALLTDLPAPTTSPAEPADREPALSS